MAAPSLSQSGVSTVTLSVASTFPSRDPKAMNQFSGISDDNTIRVASLGPPRKTLEVQFRQLNSIDVTALDAFFDNALVNWGLFPFTYTDEEGTGHNVHNLSPLFSPERVSDDNFTLNLVFTVV